MPKENRLDAKISAILLWPLIAIGVFSLAVALDRPSAAVALFRLSPLGRRGLYKSLPPV
jgi:hypothetical protein